MFNLNKKEISITLPKKNTLKIPQNLKSHNFTNKKNKNTANIKKMNFICSC